MVSLARTLGLVCLLVASSVHGRSTYDPTPPLGAMWEMQPDGDAFQKDLGFVMPEKWQGFKRLGFSSGRDDGGSVRAYYETDDHALKMDLWVQLRIDIRGLPMDADMVWDLLKVAVAAEMESKENGTELSSKPFAIGKRTPAGREMWTRFALDSGPAVQGVFWQNIGAWSVVATFSGPESRREELEKLSQALFAEMPFPYAPLAAEFAANGTQLFAAMPKCKGKPPRGAGKEFTPTFQQAALMSLLLPGMMVGQENQFIVSPVTRAQDYCVIETFKARKDFPITAIQYLGPASEAWEARYGFAINNGAGGYYQVERMPAVAARQTTTNGVTLDQVFLNFSNIKRASISAVFNDWPSYEEAKRAIIAQHKDGNPQPIITVLQTAEKREIHQNPARVLELKDN
jgi:hypothetical protein